MRARFEKQRSESWAHRLSEKTRKNYQRQQEERKDNHHRWWELICLGSALQLSVWEHRVRGCLLHWRSHFSAIWPQQKQSKKIKNNHILKWGRWVEILGSVITDSLLILSLIKWGFHAASTDTYLNVGWIPHFWSFCRNCLPALVSSFIS